MLLLLFQKTDSALFEQLFRFQDYNPWNIPQHQHWYDENATHTYLPIGEHITHPDAMPHLVIDDCNEQHEWYTNLLYSSLKANQATLLNRYHRLRPPKSHSAS